MTTCSQTRSFSYDSLSRLTSVTNPESGATSYQYDPNGNLTKKTDARGVVTDYVYDALNRVTNRSHTAPANLASYRATPTVIYTYDNVANAKGKLTKVDNGTSITEYLSFDVLGRVTRSKQTTDGVEYGGGNDESRWMKYSYNLAGMLVEQQYPSGRVVKNVLNSTGDLSIVESKKNANSGFFTYADSFSYNPAGAVTSMQLGNGRWESTLFNSRLQPTQIALGTVQNGTDKLKLDYGYGSTQNNGNILSQTITVPTETRNSTTYAGFTATQVYTYDSLNRLKSAEETIPSQAGWKQTYKFDRYGNRRFDTDAAGNTTTIEANCPEAVCNPQVSTTNNRLVGYTFDSAGNTTKDAENRKFTYDAENKQTKVETVDQNGNWVGTLGEYFYDGDGRRIKKYVPSTGELTIFVYDAASKLVAEYSTIVGPTATAKVSYLTSDHLGSPRINTDQNGNVTARHDYRPFGEEIERATYGGDQVRKQFTGYERDNESSLDFAEARYYNFNHGRFTAVDPSRKSIIPKTPQSWNRYTYCYNNPLMYVDNNGKWPSPTHDELIKNSFRGLSAKQISLIQTGSRNADRISDFKPGSTLWPSEAHKHAMTPDGMSPEQARDKAWGYLNDKLAEEKALQKGYEKMGGQGLSGSALIALGEATHVYEDMTSPAHGFDKEYKIPTMTVLVPIPGTNAMVPVTVTDVAKWKQELDEHSARESGEPTTEQKAQTALYSRAFFLIAFGEKEFRRLDLTDEERKAARELPDQYRSWRRSQ